MVFLMSSLDRPVKQREQENGWHLVKEQTDWVALGDRVVCLCSYHFHPPEVMMFFCLHWLIWMSIYWGAWSKREKRHHSCGYSVKSPFLYPTSWLSIPCEQDGGRNPSFSRILGPWNWCASIPAVDFSGKGDKRVYIPYKLGHLLTVILLSLPKAI